MTDEHTMTDDSSSPEPVAFSFQDFRDEEIVDFFANESRSFRPGHLTPEDDFGRHRLVGSPHFSAREKSRDDSDEVSEPARSSIVFKASSEMPGSNDPNKKQSRPTIVLREEPADTIPLPTDILSTDPEILRATLRDRSGVTCGTSTKNFDSEPSFGKPARPLGAVLPLPRRDTDNSREKAGRVVRDPLSGTKKEPPQRKTSRSVTMTLPVEGPLESTPMRSNDVGESLLRQIRETDEQLQRLVDSWPSLSDQIKETIASLVEVAKQDSECGA